MPLGDGTGPMGLGPMTGRGLGYCAGYDAPGYRHPGLGWRWWRGGSWGRGWWGFRRGPYSPHGTGWGRYAPLWGAYPGLVGSYCPLPTHEQESDALRRQAEWLEQSLGAIQELLDQLQQKE